MLLDATAPGLGRKLKRARAERDLRRHRRRLLREALRLRARHAGHRVHGRQPVQPGRHGRHRARHRRRQPGHQRHDVRGDAGARAPTRRATATCSATRRAASWRSAASRTGRWRARRSRSAASLGWDDFARAILERHAAGQRRQHAAALLRPGDHPAPAGARRALVRIARLRRGQGRGRRGARRRRGAGAVDAHPLRLHRPAARPASWSRAARRRTPASCGSWPTSSRPRSCRCGSPTRPRWGAPCGPPRPSRAGPGATFTPVSPPRTSTDASRPIRDQK